MNKEKTIKLVGMVITIIGFGIGIVQKQLDDKKLEDLVQKEIQKQLSNQ